MKEKLKNLKFKNPKVQALMYAFADLEEEFNKKKQGNVLAGHLISLSSTFREEHDSIIKLLTNTSTTNTKIRRKVVVKDIHANKKKVKYNKDGDCVGCKKNETVSPETVSEGIAPQGTEHKIGSEKTQLSDLKVKTWRDIVNEYNGDFEALKVFAKTNGISVGNISKVPTLAKKIFQKLIDEGFVKI